MGADNSTKEIIILGGSYAGLQASHYILKHVIPKLHEKKYHVTVIDRSTHWFARVGAPRVMVSEEALSLDKVFLPIAEGFKSYPKDLFTFTQATATALDTDARTLTLTLPGGKETVKSYYALIIATGSSPTTPLLGAVGQHTESLTAINALRERLSTNPPKRIVIAGGGPAGVESAGELGEFLNGKAGWFASRPSAIKTEITVITSTDQILPVLRPALGKAAKTMLGKVGVDVLVNTKVVSTEPPNAGQIDSTKGIDTVLTPTKVTLSNGTVINADIYIPATGTPPNSSWLLPHLLNDSGHLQVNQETHRVETAGSRVYAIGDITDIGRGGIIDIMFGFPYAINNIKRDLVYYDAVADDAKVPAGAVKDVLYHSKPSESQIVPIGHVGGVGAFLGWKFPSFFVWLMKGRDYMTPKNPEAVNGDQWAKEKIIS
jgi:NADH dehydrogenase FAD-containing subunit